MNIGEYYSTEAAPASPHKLVKVKMPVALLRTCNLTKAENSNTEGALVLFQGIAFVRNVTGISTFGGEGKESV